MACYPRAFATRILVAAATLAPLCSDAADVVKANNATALNATGSWSLGVLPTVNDVAVWDSTVLAANSTALGADLSWQGVKILNPGGAVTIGTAATNTLTLGSAGIDMSSATQNLSILSNLVVGSSQTWNVAAGRTLQITAINTNARLSGSGNISLARAGTGTANFTFNPGSSGSTGFNDQNGFYAFAGNWSIGEGVLVKTLRNGRNAWGTGTITLAGGTVAQHQNFSGTWTNNIVLQAGTTSTIDDANSTGTRTLKLLGAISGSGNLTISETGAAAYAKNGGVVLATDNTLSGTVTINGGAVLRVGGLYGATDTTLVAGTTGDLGSAAVTINSLGALTLSRSNTWTFNNSISGAGTLYVGGASGALVSGSNTQVVTLGGTNAYSGGTELVQGTLVVADIAKLGLGYLAVKGGGIFEYAGTGSETSTRSIFVDNGAATFNISSATGTLTLNPAAGILGAAGASFVKSGAGTLVFGGALGASSNQTLAVSAGRLRLTAANTFTGNTSITGGTLELSGTGSLGSGSYAGTIANAGALEFTGSATQTLSGAITGVGSLSRSGLGTLTLSSVSNAYTGGTTVANGTLALGAAGVLADAGALTVSGGTFDLGGFSETVGSVSLSSGTIRNGTLTSATEYAVTGGTIDATSVLAGAVGLNKSGAGTTTIAGTHTYTGATAVSNGILSLTTGASLASSSVTVSGGQLSIVAGVTLAPTSVTVSGGQLALGSGASLTSSSVTVSGGQLSLGAGVSLDAASINFSSGTLDLASGATLASTLALTLGNGVTLQTVDGLTLGAGRTVNLGAGAAVVAANNSGNLELSGGTLNVDFGGGSNDSLAVTGDLTLTSGTVAFANPAAYVGGKYTLISYSGALTGAASNLTLAGLASDGSSRQTFTLINDAVGKLIQLDVGGQAQNVRWTGTGGSNWGSAGLSNTNWTVTDAGYVGDQPSRFFNGDTATFDDTATSGSVVLEVALLPVSVAFTGDTLAYELTSSGGSIAGGSLVKSGASTLTLSIANAYAGGTTLSAGRIRLGADGALGTGLIVVSGGRLSAAGTVGRSVAADIRFAANVQLGDTVEGGDTGALTLSGAINLDAAARTLTLLSDVAIGGGITNGSLIKAGSGKLNLSGANALGVNLSATAGTVALGASGVIADTASISIASGVTLDLAGFSEGLAALSVAAGSTVTAGTLTSGTVTLEGASTFGATLDGTTSLVKNGADTLSLTVASTRAGTTTLNAGGIALGHATALGSGALTLAGGSLAMADATERTFANNLVLGSNVALGAVGTGRMNFGGTVGLGAQNRTLALASDVRITGVVSNGSLTKSGNGILTLSGANTFTGGATIVSGAVVVTAADALGAAGTVTLNTADTGSAATTLTIDPTAASVTLARAITVANQGSGVTVIRGASASTSGNVAVFGGAITLAKDVTLATSNVARTDFSGGISGTGNVSISTTGAGNRVIFLGANANTYSGTTTVATGNTLQLGDGTATAISYIPDASVLSLDGTLNLAKGANSETIGGLSGAGTVQGHPAVINAASTLTIGNGGNHVFSGVIGNGGATGATLSLSKSGAGIQTLSGSNATIYTGTTTVSAGVLSFTNAVVLTGNATLSGGKIQFDASSTLGSGLISGAGLGEVAFGSNVLTIGNSTASNQFYRGKLTGTGTIQLRGGSLSIQNADGTVAGTGGNFQIWEAPTAMIQDKTSQFFALDTGASATNRKDFGFVNDTGDILNLSSLTGYGAIRNDAGGTAGLTVIRNFVVDQSGDTVFNGAFLSHRSGANALRGLSLTKRGNGALELAGFVGKATTSANAGASGGVALTVEAGLLNVTNPFNTTTTNTDAIALGTVTVTGGTLGFAAQALVNTAGNAGASQVLMNGGTLRWNAGNTQDLTAGGRLRLVSGKVAIFDLGANDVVLASALGGATDASVTKLGAGALTLAGSQAYAGDTTISAGKLTLDGSTLASSVVLGTASDVEVEVLASSTVAGLSGGLGRTATLTAGTLTVSPLSGEGTFAGSLAGAGHLAKSGLGTLVLSGANSHGDTSVSAGTLRLSGAGTLGTGAVTVSGAGTLDLAGLATAKTITLSGGKLVGAGATSGLIDVTGNAALGGTVSGNLALGSDYARTVSITDGLTVSGTLGGVGSFTGGDLTVRGTHAVGNSPGFQSVTGNLTYDAGSRFDWEVDNVATWGFTLSPVRSSVAGPGDYDAVDVIGNLSITPGAYLRISTLPDALTAYADTFWSTPNNTMSFQVFAATGTISGMFTFENGTDTLAVDSLGTWTLRREDGTGFETQGIYLTYSAVPEPSTYGLALGGLALAAAAWRRRKAKQA